MSKLFAWLAVLSAATALWISAVYGPYDPTFKRQYVYPVSDAYTIVALLHLIHPEQYIVHGGSAADKCTKVHPPRIHLESLFCG